jgi:hypothetical protein
MSNVVKFPYDASRHVHSRKPRRSKNGTPEERAKKGAKAAAVVPPPATVTRLPRPHVGLLEQEVLRAFDSLDEAGKQFMNGYWQALLDQRGR